MIEDTDGREVSIPYWIVAVLLRLFLVGVQAIVGVYGLLMLLLLAMGYGTNYGLHVLGSLIVYCIANYIRKATYA